MTARVALLMFIVGTPLCLAVLAVLGHAGSAWSRRTRLVVLADDEPSRGAVAAPPAVPVRAPRAVPTLLTSIRPPRPVRTPWAPSDGLRHPLADGRSPAEATVRKRAWTSYATIADRDLYGAANVERLERGRPPVRYNPVRETLETMTVDIDEIGRARLHWPDDAQSIDPFAVQA